MFISAQSEIMAVDEMTAFLACNFDMAAFDDELYSVFGVRFPPELQASVSKRKAEFLAGRVLARTALLHVGSSSGDVAIGPHRQPIWPSGFTGAISHTDGTTVAMVTARTDCLIGVDIESILTEEAAKAVAEQVLTPREHAILIKDSRHYTRNLTILFSAKEALYKALFPKVGRFFGFDSAEIVDQPAPETITLALTSDLHGGFARGLEVDLHWRFLGGKILTWMKTSLCDLRPSEVR